MMHPFSLVCSKVTWKILHDTTKCQLALLQLELEQQAKKCDGPESHWSKSEGESSGPVQSQQSLKGCCVWTSNWTSN